MLGVGNVTVYHGGEYQRSEAGDYFEIEGKVAHSQVQARELQCDWKVKLR